MPERWASPGNGSTFEYHIHASLSESLTTVLLTYFQVRHLPPVTLPIGGTGDLHTSSQQWLSPTHHHQLWGLGSPLWPKKTNTSPVCWSRCHNNSICIWSVTIKCSVQLITSAIWPLQTATVFTKLDPGNAGGGSETSGGNIKNGIL